MVQMRKDTIVLCKAINKRDKETAKKLLQNGVGIDDNSGVLHSAIISFDDLEIIQMLLDKGTNIHTKNEHNKKPLHVAIQNNKTEAALLLIEKGALAGEDLCSLLKMAISQENLKIIETLLEEGANVHLQTPNNSFVFNAINKRQLKIAELFLDYNADISYISREGHTLLHKAIECCCSGEFIKKLLKLNVPVNTKDVYGNSPFLTACCSQSADQLQIIEMLHQYNADINYTNVDMMTPLHCVFEKNHLHVVEILIKKGSNLHARNHNGRTPLHFACAIDHDDRMQSLLELLLNHGANIEAMDNYGWTPLIVACINKNIETVKFLLGSYHANPNHTDLYNFTPLHILVENAWRSTDKNFPMDAGIDYQLVEILIQYGANIDVVNDINQTPLDIAVEEIIFYSNDDLHNAPYFRRNYEMIIKILLSQGIILKTAGLEVHNHHSNQVYDNEDITIDNVKYSVNDILQFNIASDSNDVFDNEDSIGDIRQLKFKCEQEIQKMKTESIGIDDLTFYDLLEGNIYRLSSFFENDEIQRKINSRVYDNTYPLYKYIVNNRLRNAKIRYEHYMLRMSAREYFILNINENLPDECIDEILSYLNITEIKMFIEAMENY